MLCSECKKNEATTYVESIINGKKTTRYLCDECAQKLQIGEMNLFDFGKFFKGNDLFSNFFNVLPQSLISQEKTVLNDKACDKCGTRLSTMLKDGFVGCVDCYEAFQGDIKQIVKNMQGSSKHIGKIPNVGINESALKHQNLKLELQKAIDEERYEDAARINKEIKILEESENDGKKK